MLLQRRAGDHYSHNLRMRVAHALRFFSTEGEQGVQVGKDNYDACTHPDFGRNCRLGLQLLAREMLPERVTRERPAAGGTGSDIRAREKSYTESAMRRCSG